MDEFLRYNWTGYGRPGFRFTGRVRPDGPLIDWDYEDEFHSAVAERRLQEEGIKPELNLYLIGIGGMAR